jgi:hypothetical protein
MSSSVLFGAAAGMKITIKRTGQDSESSENSDVIDKSTEIKGRNPDEFQLASGANPCDSGRNYQTGANGMNYSP